MSTSLTDALRLSVPLIAAPMAGGPSTPPLVASAADAGGCGFVAAGYKTPQALDEELAAVAAASVPFGVNLFVPNPVHIELTAFRQYAGLIAREADRFGIALDSSTAVEDDDRWHDKIDVLRARSTPVISLTFGLPSSQDITALRATGALLIQTVTNVDEAKAAAAAGVDALAVQGPAAGGHFGTFTPTRPVVYTSTIDLVAAVRHAVDLPLIAAGGLATAEDVAAAVSAGAEAVAVGTVLLRSHEAGTSATHKAALADPNRQETVVTHAFTGRPARALRNDFIERYSDLAPYGYPAIHHLTSGMRKAAAAAGDPERVHLWAGTGFRHATDEPAAVILSRLASQL